MPIELTETTEALVAAAERVRELVPETMQAPREKMPAGLIQAALLHRATRTTAAGLAMCRQGYGEQALMLARSVFEDMIDTHWVASDPDGAVAQFDDAALIARGLRDASTAGYREQFGLPAIEEAPLTDELKERQARLIKKHRPGSWTGRGMGARKKAAREFFEPDQVGIFDLIANLGEGLASDMVHSSPLAIYSAITLESTSPGVEFRGKTEQHVRSAALLLGYCLAHLLGRVASEFELDGDDERNAAYMALLEAANREDDA